jgi:hypothetical protein
LVEGREQDWAGWIWSMLAAGIAVLGVFAWHQLRRDRRDGSALLPMHLFANRGYSAGLVTQALFQGSMAGFVLVLAIYVQNGLGFSAIAAGLTLLPFSVGAFIGTGISVPLGVKLGKIIMRWRDPSVDLHLRAVQVMHEQGATLTGWNLAPAMALGGIGLGLRSSHDRRGSGHDPATRRGCRLRCLRHDPAGGCRDRRRHRRRGLLRRVGTTFTQARLEEAITAASWVGIIGFALCALATTLPSRRPSRRARPSASGNWQCRPDRIALRRSQRRVASRQCRAATRLEDLERSSGRTRRR